MYSDFLRFIKTNRRTKLTRDRQTKTKAIIYINNTTSFLNQRSAKPNTRKAKATKLVINPVKTMQFGLLSKKKQYNGAIPIFILLFLLNFIYEKLFYLK